MGRIALIGDNSVEYINALIDIWNLNCCAVLLDWRIPFSMIYRMMLDADVKICYIDKKVYDKIDPIFHHGIKYIVFENLENNARILPNEVRAKYCSRYDKKEAVIFYSSGTTGKSKGIILTHYAISTNADSIIDYMRPCPEDCLYIAKSLSHSSTLTGELLVALKSGSSIIIAPTIVPPRFVFENIIQYHVTIICLNPTLASLYANEYSHNKYSGLTLRTIYVSGSILNDNVYNFVHRIFDGIAVYNVYGLSEAGPRVAAQRVGCCKGNSVGKSIKDVQVVIVDNYGNVLQNECRGIIHVNTPSRYKKYVKGKSKHKSLYNGWLNTGDIGYIDLNNELHIVDRIDDVIIIDSHKIYPHDVERQIMLCTGIAECAVVKIANEERALIACLYVSKRNHDEIRQQLKNALLTYEIPHFFLRADELPLNINKKRDLFQIKKILEDGFTVKETFEQNIVNEELKEIEWNFYFEDAIYPAPTTGKLSYFIGMM